MSSDILARIEALTNKADVAQSNGRLLRAAEYYRCAAEVARELGPDNLVAIQLQLFQGTHLGDYGFSRLYFAVDADAAVLAAHRAQAKALLLDAIEVLDRRRAADTLLEGKCSPDEAWYCRFSSASVAPLIGYDVFMMAALQATVMILRADAYQAEDSESQLRVCFHHVMCAAHLMQQPRRCVSILPGEALFVDALRSATAAAAEDDEPELPPLIQLLAGVLHTLERSGMLKTEHIDEMIHLSTSIHDQNRDATIESMSDSGRRRCALAGCGAKEAHVSHFKACAACKAVVYCSREHQVADWPNHKAACKAAAAERRGKATKAE